MLSPWAFMHGGTPIQGFRFFVMFVDNLRIPQVLDTRFSKVSGIGVEVKDETFEQGGQSKFASRKASHRPAKYAPLVFSRGMPVFSILTMELEFIIQNARSSTFTIFMLILDETGLPTSAWQFERARPTKWKISDLDASASGPVIETMELSYERYQRIPLGL